MRRTSDTPRRLGDLRPSAPVSRKDRRLTLGAAIKGLRGSGPYVLGDPQLDHQGKLSLEAFMLRYLPHHFDKPFCEMHRDLIRACDAPSPEKGKRVARIAPRMMGKTSIISLALPLKKLAYQEKYYVLMIGESADTSEANLATLAHECETNERLLEDFPHLAPARDLRGQTMKWTDRQIVFANFATVRAKGMGARMRGMKHRQRRPDLAILDDPESPETADTFLKRRRHKRWFGGTFMGLGARGWDIFVIGNLPHHDCLIADLVKDPTWDGTLWRAENLPQRENERYPVGNTKEDGSPLWPEVWPLTALMAYKAEPNVGSLGYAREMLNDPREEENKEFNIYEFALVDFTPADLSRYIEMVIAVDPAGGEHPGEVRRGRRDYCAVVGMGRTRDNFIEVFAVTLAKVLPDKQIDLVLDMYDFCRAPVVVEENMYKNLLASAMGRRAQERQLYPSIMTVTHAQNKITRILSLQPPIRSRIIRFARYLFDTVPEFFAQFDEFPGSYDDGPDAMESGLRKLEKKVVGPVTGIVSLTRPSYWRSGGMGR